MNTESTRTVNEYTLYVVGIFGRNRSVKRKVITLKEVPVDATQPELTHLKALATFAIREIKLKSVPPARVYISVNEVKIENRGDGVVARLFAPYDSKTLHSEVIG